MNLNGKNIILGVCGGIAAYKAAEVIRLLKKDGADVWVVMTEKAKEFLSPLTLQTLSENPVYSDLFHNECKYPMPHIDLAKKCHLLLIAPATANTIGKCASGIADDLLSTLFLSVSSSVLIAPAMNNNMYTNPVVQENIKKLKGFNVNFVEPEFGELACGDQGEGRLAEPDAIISRAKELLYEKKNLIGKNILVTAGPTHEQIDPIRFISNLSSGKMGYAIARAAKRRGGNVILISGPTNISPPPSIQFIPVKSADDMRREVLNEYKKADVIIMTAAVSDFSPIRYFDKKIKSKESEGITLKLKKTSDILSEVSNRQAVSSQKKIIVGFALETDNIIKNAKEKLKKKNMDFIVANSINGFGSDLNKVAIIDRRGTVEDIPLVSKDRIAEILMDKIEKGLKVKYVK
jgi:phosphopantothenoylcysteine decarboxylase/phosphopantothenate--cysteine ligase